VRRKVIHSFRLLFGGPVDKCDIANSAHVRHDEGERILNRREAGNLLTTAARGLQALDA